MLRALLDRPISVLIGALALVTIGGASLLRLPVSLLPTLERPKLVVVATDLDRSRQSLLQEVVEPLERALLSVPGVLAVSSRVDDGRARLELDTEWQTDPDQLRIDAERRRAVVSGVALDSLSISIEAGDRSPIVSVVVRGGRSAHHRTAWAEQVLRPELARLRGAGRIERTGGALERVVVRPIAPALAARGMGASAVADRLSRVGMTRPLGTVRDGGATRPVVLHERVRSIEQLSDLWITQPDGSRARLGDVAESRREEVPDRGHYRIGGADALLLELYRAPEANAVALARQARATVGELAARAPVGVEVEVIDDASREVLGAVSQLGLAALLGLVLGTIVLRFLLGHWRPTFVMSVVVPASLISALGAFLLWDVSLDVVSLAGLALALGMLVDNAIVVLESIERQDDPSSADADNSDLAVEGTLSIAIPLLAGFLTTAAVFVPLIYLRGLARAFFGVQAFAIVTTLALSLLFSLTLAPVLARILGTRRRTAGRQPGRSAYLELLGSSLRHPWLTVGLLTGVAAATTVLTLRTIERELVPPGHSDVLLVPFQLSPGLDEESQHEQVRAVEAVVLERLGEAGLEAARVDVRYREWQLEDASRSSDALDGLATVRLREGQETSPEGTPSGSGDATTAALARSIAESLPGVTLRVERQHAAFARALERAEGRWQVEVSAPTTARVDRLASRVTESFAERGLELRDADTVRQRTLLTLAWDRHRLADLGLSEAAASGQVSSALGGRFRGQFDDESLEPEMLLEQTLPGALELVPIVPPRAADPTSDTSAGQDAAPSLDVLPLGALARLEQSRREPEWLRRNGRPTRLLDLVGPTSQERATRVPRPDGLRSTLDAVPRDGDERLALGGDAAELARAFTQLRLALALAVLLVFLTLAALYESIAVPVAVMATVPIAVGGALALLLVTGQSLNVMSFLGLILLIGIVVNNSIVLLHRAIQHRQRGSSLDDALRRAAEERYRPILMTTLTTVLGMAPLALLGGEGAELRRALAVATCGGLSAGLVASLLLTPSLFAIFAPPSARATSDAPSTSEQAP